jgi:hypothetical protein
MTDKPSTQLAIQARQFAGNFSVKIGLTKDKFMLRDHDNVCNLSLPIAVLPFCVDGDEITIYFTAVRTSVEPIEQIGLVMPEPSKLIRPQ